MKVSRILATAATAALVLPLAWLTAQAAIPRPLPQEPKAQPKTIPPATFAKAAVPKANGDPWAMGPIPKSIQAQVSGVALDDQGRPVPEAKITLYAVKEDDAEPAATTTTDAEGRYAFHDVDLPVIPYKENNGYPGPPHAWFLVSGQAPDMGIAWRRLWSMYTYDPAHGGFRVGSSATLDLTFAKSASLLGKVVNESGEPVFGAEVRVLGSAQIGADGREEGDLRGAMWDDHWPEVPEGVGRTLTGADGGFHLERLPANSCFQIEILRPGASGARLTFSAATVEGPDQAHPGQNIVNFIISPHEARTNPIRVVFPRVRPIDVAVVGEDGRAVAGARVTVVNAFETAAADVSASGETDAAGNLRVGLPPGKFASFQSRPPARSRYLPTYDQMPDVEPGTEPVSLTIRQKVGAELILEAVDDDAGKPMEGVFFGWSADGGAERQLKSHQDVSIVLTNRWTDADGKLHVAVDADPGRRYRFHFGGLRGAISLTFQPDRPEKYGYEATPAQSEPVELVAGKPIRLRFKVRKL